MTVAITITRKDKRTRLLHIIRIMRNYNMVHNFVHQTNPEKFRQALEELGPTFIKAGQLLSTRPDLVSPTYIKELRKLQDDVEEDDYATIAQIYEKQTGQSIDDTFKSFDHKPFASASIGQTHHAILKDGTAVVVKIQHPGVEELVRTDLALFRKALSILKFVPDIEVINVHETLNEIRTALLNEINTQVEIQNGIEFYRLNNYDGIFRVPQVYQQYSAPKVLVNEAMPGKSIKYLIQQTAEPETVAATELNKTKKYVARALVENFIKQVFVDHFFHADPHPGNILFHRLNYQEEVAEQYDDRNVNADKNSSEQLPPYRLIYLDFGMMGRLTPSLADGIAKIVIALNSKNPRKVGQAILNVCNHIGKVDEENFYEDINEFITPYLKAEIGEIDFATAIFQMMTLCHQNNLQMKPEVTLLFKSFGTLEGIVAQLDPELSLMDIARPFGIKYLKQKFNFKNSIDDFTWQTLNTAQEIPLIPQKINQLLDILTTNHARVTFKLKNQSQILYRIDQIVNRIVVTIILAAVILGSSMLVQGSSSHSIVYRLGVTGFIVSLIVIVLMVIGGIHRHLKDKRKIE